jgi:hypothetical protein
MSELEFQRELTPDQMHEALSLLDGTARAKNRNLQVEDLGPAHEDYPRADHASTTRAMQDRVPAPEDPQQRKKALQLVLARYGIGIAVAAAALTLLFWSERVLTPPPLPAIARVQLPSQPAGQLVKSASPSVPVTIPTPDPGGSARPALKPEVAGQSPVGQTNRDNQAAVPDAANSPNAAQTATLAAIATRQDWTDEQARRKPKAAWRHAPAVRVAAEKKRYWRRHWQARAEIYSGPSFLFICLPPRVVYIPAR